MSWILGVLWWIAVGCAIWRLTGGGKKIMGIKTTDDKVRAIRKRFDHLNEKGCATEAQVSVLLQENSALEHTAQQRELADDMLDHLQAVHEMEDTE